MAQRFAQQLAGQRLFATHDVIDRSLGDEPSAVGTGTGTEINDVLGATDRVLIVLDHNDGVTLRFEFMQRVEQHQVVARMQADGRFVENVTDPAQVGAELRRETDALRLTATQGRRGTVERKI